MAELNGTSPIHLPQSESEDETTTVLDLVLILARDRRLVAWTTAFFTLIGVTFAIFTDARYTSTAKVIREAEDQSTMSGLGGLAALRVLGLNIGSSSVGLTPESYPDIARSREVILAVARDTFYFQDRDTVLTLMEYLERDSGPKSESTTGTYSLNQTLSNLSDKTALSFTSEAEARVIRKIEKLISTSVDQTSGLMTVTATTRDPFLSAGLVKSFLHHLGQRIIEIRTEKARRNLEFVQNRFKESETELRLAEEELARFQDQNHGPQTAQLRTQLERLRRNVSFKTELYSDLQTQLTNAEMEYQRSLPVMTVIEEPVPLLKPSGPNRPLTAIISILFGMLAGFALAFIRSIFLKHNQHEDTRKKLEEIQNLLLPTSKGHNTESQHADSPIKQQSLA